MKRFFHRFIALLSACTLMLAASLPAMAGGEESLFLDMQPGDYTMTYLRFNVLNPGDEVGVPSSARLYGPDVAADGSIALQQGHNYTFYYEQTMPYGYRPTYGFNAKTQIGYYTLTGSADYYIPIDGKTMFAFPAEGADVSVKISFNNVSLHSWLAVYGAADVYGPTVQLNGQISIEVTTTVDGVFTIPERNDTIEYETVQDYEDELIAILDECSTAARAGDTQYGTMFSEPQEISYRIDLDGNMIGFGAEYPETALNIGFSVMGEQDYTVDFQGQTYVTAVRDEASGGVDFNAYSMECFLTINALDWTFVLQEARDPAPTDTNDYTVTVVEAVTVTAGAGAAALGGSALANVLGDAVSSAATNIVAGDPTAGDLTSSELPEADLPADKKKSLLADKEDDDNVPDDSPDTDTPDLPEEDSPEVSMSLSAPGSDLLNTKGGAVDITVELSGGDGYDWHYIPAVIVPGAAKAIIPTVVKQGTRATLILAITGAELEERHHTVFVNLIAWAMTADGKVLKTSGSMEMKLHRKGLEAKREKDGSLTITAYGETTLKGYAEIKTLSAEEYDCTEDEDGTVHVQAKDTDLGSVDLKSKK